jgi:hypothetical protein
VLAGALWWWLAPLARTDVSDGSVYLTGHQELQAAQDGWFVVVLGAVGVITATVNGWRGFAPSHHPSSGHLGGRGGHEARRLVVLAAALLLVGAVAWQTGEWLGPADLADQVTGGSRHPLTPLRLHSPAALLVGPFLFAFTSFLASVFGGGSGRDR